MNSLNHLILVKGIDKTISITSWRYEPHKPIIWLSFGTKEYPYHSSDVEFLKNPRTIDVTNSLVLDHKTQCPGASKVQFFDQYARIIYPSGYSKVSLSNHITIVPSELNNAVSKNCFDYLKRIAMSIGIHTEDGHNILFSRYEKLDFIRKDSVLANYLNRKLSDNHIPNDNITLYPFGFNLSQKEAVRNALNSRVSIIEGPPGTGKTQTILNIIANAILRDETVAIVSSNNSATSNVYEKLKKHHVEFVAAPLGNANNKEAFIESQKAMLPNSNELKNDPESEKQLIAKLESEEKELDRLLEKKNQLSKMLLEKDQLKKEYDHFTDLLENSETEKTISVFSKRAKGNTILSFLSEYETIIASGSKISLSSKLRWKFFYKLKKLSFLKLGFEQLRLSCQNQYYKEQIASLEKIISSLQSDLKSFCFESRMNEYASDSMKVLRGCLAKKYSANNRQIYEIDDLWKHSEKFLRDYPVILSTTYSLRTSLSKEIVYDYVIIDEASQVDLATGALALSCAKKAVIVGDLKQLPNVITPQDRIKTDLIFDSYKLPESYRFSNHSILSSVSSLFPDVPKTLLKEHYRCHPEIINFCNQRFYNNELIILTQPSADTIPLYIYKTAPGNHARGHLNYRQIEVIKNEVIPQLQIDIQNECVGIVTPYREQANALQAEFLNTTIKADTADKFQGQECDIMIFSTVDNEIGDFASDPNRLNVAVSRAIKQFIVVTDGNENDSVSPIHDLLEYIQYQNHSIINSSIHSVFDYLYKNQAQARELVLQKYGRISEYESENLMYQIIKEVLEQHEFEKYDVVAHVPLRQLIRDYHELNQRESLFATNPFSHIDFLIYSKLSHHPILAIEVDGFAFHQASEKQTERDTVKDSIFSKCGIQLLRFSTTGSNEKERIIHFLSSIA